MMEKSLCGADSDGQGLITAEVYDAVGSTSTATKNMGTSHGLHTAVLLNDGTVLVMGGGTTLAELYDAGVAVSAGRAA